MSRKKIIERRLFEQFAEAARIQADMVDDEGERPDLIVKHDGRTVGVEVTEFFRPNDDPMNPAQAQEAAAALIVAAAQRAYQRVGGPPMHVQVRFRQSSDLRKVSRANTGKAIADQVKRLNVPAGERREVRSWYPDSILPGIVDSVTVHGARGSWYVKTVGWMAPLDPALLQSRIDDKARRLDEYRKRVPENWLLIAVQGTRVSQFFDYDVGIDTSKLSSPFERTFYFDGMSRDWFDLG